MVETGGILQGTRTKQGEVVISAWVLVPDAAQKRHKYTISGDQLDRYISKTDFLGFYHTHQFWPFFGVRDYLTMRAATAELNRELVLGIYRKQLRLWIFSPHHLRPRRVRLSPDSVSFDKQLK